MTQDTFLKNFLERCPVFSFFDQRGEYEKDEKVEMDGSSF